MFSYQPFPDSWLFSYMEVHISTLRHNSAGYGYARQKISMKYFFSKCDQIRSFLKKLMEVSAFI